MASSPLASKAASSAAGTVACAVTLDHPVGDRRREVPRGRDRLRAGAGHRDAGHDASPARTVISWFAIAPVVDLLVRQQAPGPQDWHDALTHLVGLLQVRIAGEDELVDSELVILGDPIGDLVVAADQGGAGAAADQPDARPQVR